MGFFSSFRQLLSKKERRNSTAPSLISTKKRNTVSNATELTKSSSVAAATNSTNISSPTSSKEGYNFKYEGGRRYHGYDDVAYVMPNDDDEADRLHQQHWVLRYVLQCNFFAPVAKMLEEGIKVLDNGTGPATWAFELAEAYPKSKFCGIDVTAVFPEKIMPPNAEFMIGNIAKEIPYSDNTFDYVHQRLLFAGLTSDDWTTALKECYRVLKPGGYIELGELDLQDLINMGPILGKMQNMTANMFVARGIPAKVCPELEGRLINAGFENAVLKVVPIPLNHKGKAGKLMWEDYKHAYSNVKSVLAKLNPEWEDAGAYDAYLNECGVESKKNKTSINFYAIYAQKPLQ